MECLYVSYPWSWNCRIAHFSENGIFHNSRGAVPSMCSPKWNLSWYYDSWGSNKKMIYILVRVDMRLRKEVMRAYSWKGRNNDVFIIYMTVPPRNCGNSAWKLAKSRHGKYERYFINHQSDMDDSDIVQGWDLKDCLGLHPTSVSIIALELKLSIADFSEN